MRVANSWTAENPFTPPHRFQKTEEFALCSIVVLILIMGKLL
jgi:hypothetical protein